RRANEEVHPVIVLGAAIVDSTGGDPARIADRQCQPATSVDRRSQFERLVDISCVGRRLRAPPPVAKPHEQHHHSSADSSCDPAVISHKGPVNSRGSSCDRTAASGNGANRAPAPVSGSGTIRTSRTCGSIVRISTSATPGITRGGQIVTSSRYGPAELSTNTS